MNIYQSLYDLLNQYVFNNSVVVGSYQELVLTLVSTLGWVLCVALPFIAVYKFIKDVL